MTSTGWITIVETPAFLTKAAKHFDEKDRRHLVAHLSANPLEGVIMEGTGGVRKLRWARKGAGKSGGFRIVYIYHDDAMPLFILTKFAKNEKINLSKAERNAIRTGIKALLGPYKRRTPKHVKGI